MACVSNKLSQTVGLFKNMITLTYISFSLIIIKELTRKLSEERGAGKVERKTPLQSNRNITNKQKETKQHFVSYFCYYYSLLLIPTINFK